MSTYNKYTDYDIVSVAPGTSATLQELGPKTVNECATLCDSNSACIGFSINTNSTNNCFLKQNIGSPSLNSGSYVKQIDSYIKVGNDGIGRDGSPYVHHPQNNIPYTTYTTNTSTFTTTPRYDDPPFQKLKDYATKYNVDLTACTSGYQSIVDQCKIETVQKHMRDNIDRKVAEIYKAPGTNTSAFDDNYQTTMLTGLVWALLGTTVLYYTFKNL